jgi:hypothetical protein
MSMRRAMRRPSEKCGYTWIVTIEAKPFPCKLEMRHASTHHAVRSLDRRHPASWWLEVVIDTGALVGHRRRSRPAIFGLQRMSECCRMNRGWALPVTDPLKTP